MIKGITSGITKSITQGLTGGGGVQQDDDADAYFTAVEGAGAALSDADKAAITSFVIDIKSAGVWDKIDSASIFKGASTLAGALIKLKGTGANTNNNFVAGDYSAATGLTGDGVTKYINTNRTAATVFSTNNGHLCVWSTSSDLRTDSVEMSAAVSSNQVIGCVNLTGLVGGDGPRSHLFDSDPAGGELVIATGLAESGMFVASRTSASDHRIFFNGTQKGATQTTSGGLAPNRNIDVFRLEIAGGLYSNRTLAYYSFGDGLTPSEVSSYNTALTTLIGALS